MISIKSFCPAGRELPQDRIRQKRRKRNYGDKMEEKMCELNPDLIVLAGFLVLFAGVPQIESGEQQPPRTEPGMESQVWELPEGEGGEEGVRPYGDLEDEKDIYI